MNPSFKFNRPHGKSAGTSFASSSSSSSVSSSFEGFSSATARGNSHSKDVHNSVRITTNTNSCSNSDDDEIHPIELVVQDIVGPSLDSMESKLSQLRDSQYILLGRLHILEKKMKEFDDNVSIINTNDVITRINLLKNKLTKIVTTLEIVQKRLANTVQD